MKKNTIWIIVFAAAVVLCLGVWSALKNSSGGSIAVITVDGKEYKKIDLDRVDEPYDIEISTQYGSNIVHVEKGAISVTHADCPDKICVNQGKITSSGVPVVCAPHRLYIAIEGNEIDAF